MEVNQDQAIPEVEGVLEDTADLAEEETQEMIEAEEDPETWKVKIVTADVVDGNTVKLKGLNLIIPR